MAQSWRRGGNKPLVCIVDTWGNNKQTTAIQLLLQSLSTFSDTRAFDLLFVTNNARIAHVMRLVEVDAFTFDVHMVPVDYDKGMAKARVLEIVDYPLIHQYSKVLVLDPDVIVQKDLSEEAAFVNARPRAGVLHTVAFDSCFGGAMLFSPSAKTMAVFRTARDACFAISLAKDKTCCIDAIKILQQSGAKVDTRLMAGWLQEFSHNPQSCYDNAILVLFKADQYGDTHHKTRNRTKMHFLRRLMRNYCGRKFSTSRNMHVQIDKDAVMKSYTPPRQ